MAIDYRRGYSALAEHQPRRIPSPKWRELIKKVWEADPLLCPKCSREMRIVALIDDRVVIERILRHLGLWETGVRVSPARAPPEPGEWVIEPCYDDPFPCLPRRSEAKTGLRHRTGLLVLRSLGVGGGQTQTVETNATGTACLAPALRSALTHPAPSHTLHTSQSGSE